MALKNLFEMVKADRYTADGKEELIKAQEKETEDRRYQNGEISEKTGLMKTPNGWVEPPNGKAPAGRNHGTVQKKRGKGAIATPGKGKSDKQKALEEVEKAIDNAGDYDDIEELENERQSLLKEIEEESKTTESESKPAVGSIIKFEDAQKAIENGQVVQWQDRDGNWNDVDPKTSELTMARSMGSKLRVKTDADGTPAKQKAEPTMNETRNKLLELEEKRKKFEKYPDMDNSIKLQQAALLSKAGFNSRAEFEEFVKSETSTDSAPRVLTGDCKIRVRNKK